MKSPGAALSPSFGIKLAAAQVLSGWPQKLRYPITRSLVRSAEAEFKLVSSRHVGSVIATSLRPVLLRLPPSSLVHRGSSFQPKSGERPEGSGKPIRSHARHHGHGSPSLCDEFAISSHRSCPQGNQVVSLGRAQAYGSQSVWRCLQNLRDTARSFWDFSTRIWRSPTDALWCAR